MPVSSEIHIFFLIFVKMISWTSLVFTLSLAMLFSDGFGCFSFVFVEMPVLSSGDFI